ncbi:hypothetical protein HZB60_11680 [candidate division KSB1 bacterium]|nr:hypothetical protein [candidate division KSB1 bacterium]
MACPVASTLSLGAAFGGVYTLFVQDRKRRLVSLSVFVLLLAGWAGYYALARTPQVRLALDISSTAAVLAGGWRLYRLVRYEGVVPPFTAAMSRLLTVLRPVVRSPWVLSLKIWLLFMVVTEWRGLADFSGLEYGVVSVLLVGMIGWRAVRGGNSGSG